jgi:uncharacterized protein
MEPAEMALEKFERTVDVGADAGRAWQVLTDVQELTTWVGIIHSVTELERLKSYTAVLEDRVGPFNLRADLSISVDVVEEGSAIHVEASGRDRAINSKIDILGDLRLAGLPSGGSRLTVSGSYQVTGRATAMGAGIVRRKGDLAIEQFFSSAIRVLGDPGQDSK